MDVMAHAFYKNAQFTSQNDHEPALANALMQRKAGNGNR
jgi:hypothetical protein